MHLLVACESSLNAPGSFSGDRSLCLVAGLVRCRSDIPGSSNLVVGRSICHACGACSSASGWLRFRFCGIAHTPSLHLPSFSILLLCASGLPQGRKNLRLNLSHRCFLVLPLPFVTSPQFTLHESGKELIFSPLPLPLASLALRFKAQGGICRSPISVSSSCLLTCP